MLVNVVHVECVHVPARVFFTPFRTGKPHLGSGRPFSAELQVSVVVRKRTPSSWLPGSNQCVCVGICDLLIVCVFVAQAGLSVTVLFASYLAQQHFRPFVSAASLSSGLQASVWGR
jgi:hypothetical protein